MDICPLDIKRSMCILVLKESEKMKASEFLKDLTKEIEENGWGDLEIEFYTGPFGGPLYWLSVYEEDGVLCMDIGDE